MRSAYGCNHQFRLQEPCCRNKATHHRQLWIETWINTELKATSCAARSAASRFGQDLVWDATVACEDGRVDDHVRQ